MAPHGTITTDGFRAYARIARELDLVHRSVNHSVEFVTDQGWHSNNAEGVHKLLKSASRKQFGRLPSVNPNGVPFYLLLIMLKVNHSLSKKNEDGWRVGSLFAAFCAYLKNYNELGPLDPVYRHFVELEPEEPGDAEIDNMLCIFLTSAQTLSQMLELCSILWTQSSCLTNSY